MSQKNLMNYAKHNRLCQKYSSEKSDLDLQCLFAVLIRQEGYKDKYRDWKQCSQSWSNLKVAERLKMDPIVRTIFPKAKKKVSSLVNSSLTPLFHDDLGRDLEPADRITLQSIRNLFELEEYKNSPQPPSFCQEGL